MGKREILAISISNLKAVYFKDKDLYRWLDSATPIANAGYSIYVYELTGNPILQLNLAKTYLNAGPSPLAIPLLKEVLERDPGNREARELLAKHDQQ